MDRQLVNVYLGGELGQLLKPSWRLAVSSPAEAIRAIDINTRGKFRKYLLTQGRETCYRIALQEPDKNIEAIEIANKSGVSDIYILPVIAGQNSGLGKILIGVVILAAVIFAPELGLASTFFTSGGGLSVYGSLAVGIGSSLILGGISQLLAPHKQQNGELGSAVFQGTINAGLQGGAVPVVYGKALVAPTPISIWFNNVDYFTTQNQFAGVANLTELPGGGYQVSVPASAVTVTNGTTIIS